MLPACAGGVLGCRGQPCGRAATAIPGGAGDHPGLAPGPHCHPLPPALQRHRHHHPPWQVHAPPLHAFVCICCIIFDRKPGPVVLLATPWPPLVLFHVTQNGLVGLWLLACTRWPACRCGIIQAALTEHLVKTTCLCRHKTVSLLETAMQMLQRRAESCALHAHPQPYQVSSADA